MGRRPRVVGQPSGRGLTNSNTWNVEADAALARERDARCLVTILTHARIILADPDCWARGALARSLVQRSVLPASDAAHSWSASGALALALRHRLGTHASLGDRERLYDLGIRSLWFSLPDEHPRTLRMSLDIDGFNDYPGTRYQDVVQLFERAVDDARSAL